MSRELSQRSKADARQPFTTAELAIKCAEILEHMTGEKCVVISRGQAYHYILRQSGTKLVRG